MRPRALRATIRGAMTMVALAAALCVFPLMPLIRNFEKANESRERSQIVYAVLNAIQALKRRVPAGVDPVEWQSAVELTGLMHFNACSQFHPPPIEEMRRLRGDVVAKLRGPVDIKTLTWIWDRLARTGVDGKGCTDARTEDLEKCFPGRHLSR
jgi:hypothetical protein